MDIQCPKMYKKYTHLPKIKNIRQRALLLSMDDTCHTIYFHDAISLKNYFPSIKIRCLSALSHIHQYELTLLLSFICSQSRESHESKMRKKDRKERSEPKVTRVLHSSPHGDLSVTVDTCGPEKPEQKSRSWALRVLV